MSRLTLQSTYKLASGFQIPVVGFGVFQTARAETEAVVLKAIEVGYRHVDSARAYRNEGPTADAIRKSGIPRSDLYFTTKIRTSEMGYAPAKRALQSSFNETGLDYFDLVLIHAPYGGREARLGTWRALVEAQKSGKVRSIGVSNYGVHHLEELDEYIKNGGGGEISVGQYEIHPWLPREDIVDWCRKHNVVVEAYSPLVQGVRANEPVLTALTKKYNKSFAQVLVRWSLQKGHVPLPKTATHSRVGPNVDVFDFELDEADMKTLETGQYAPVCWDPTKSFD